jgi:hypothetical protein
MNIDELGRDTLRYAADIYNEYVNNGNKLPFVPKSCCDVQKYICMQDYFKMVTSVTGVSEIFALFMDYKENTKAVNRESVFSEEENFVSFCRAQYPIVEDLLKKNGQVLYFDRAEWDYCVPYKDTCSKAMNFGHYRFFFLCRLQAALHLSIIIPLVCVATTHVVEARSAGKTFISKIGSLPRPPPDSGQHSRFSSAATLKTLQQQQTE